MKRFIFGLETVLTLRRRDEEEQRELYGKALANRDSLRLGVGNPVCGLDGVAKKCSSP